MNVFSSIINTCLGWGGGGQSYKGFRSVNNTREIGIKYQIDLAIRKHCASPANALTTQYMY